MRVALLLLLLLVAPGCYLARSTRHRPLVAAEIDSLRPGVTTADDALERLGAPTDVVQLGRRSAYRYDYGVEKTAGVFLLLVGLAGTDATEDRAWLFFDEQGVLTHVGTTLQAGDARYVVPLLRD